LQPTWSPSIKRRPRHNWRFPCEANPDLLLFAVDFRTGQALVLSSQSSPVLTTDDLAHVIDAHAAYKNTGERESKSEQPKPIEVQKS
jgi:hypothetical protein